MIQYVGETSRYSRECIDNHHFDIRPKKNTAVALHFNEILHRFEDFSVIPIAIIPDSILRKDKESYRIRQSQLQTKYPLIINSCFRFVQSMLRISFLVLFIS